MESSRHLSSEEPRMKPNSIGIIVGLCLVGYASTGTAYENHCAKAKDKASGTLVKCLLRSLGGSACNAPRDPLRCNLRFAEQWNKAQSDFGLQCARLDDLPDGQSDATVFAQKQHERQCPQQLILFLMRQTFDGLGSYASGYDAKCQYAALVAGITPKPGYAFQALVSGMSEQGRRDFINLIDPNAIYLTVRGAIIARSGGLANGALLIAPNVDESNVTIVDNIPALTGTTQSGGMAREGDLSLPGGSLDFNCTHGPYDFVTNYPRAYAVIGDPQSKTITFMSTLTYRSCDSEFRLYCGEVKQ